MGNLEVRIRHGGGGFGSPMLWVIAVAVIVVFAVLGGAAAGAITSIVTTLAILLASVIGGGAVLGVLIWFLTRGSRARRAQAFADNRAAREASYRSHQLDLVRERARIKAQEHAAMAAMVAEAVRASQQQPLWPQVGYRPTIKAEVLKPEDEH